MRLQAIVLALLVVFSAWVPAAAQLPQPLSVTKLPYLGKERLFGVAFDDPRPYIHRNEDDMQNYTYYLLEDLTANSAKTKYTALASPRPDVVPPFDRWLEMNSTGNHISWIFQDLEYDYRNTVQLHGLSHQWNSTCTHEFAEPCRSAASPYYYFSQDDADRAVRRAYEIYSDTMGRNATVWKFPGYREGNFGLNAILRAFPFVTHFRTNETYIPVIQGKRVVVKDDMPFFWTMPNSFSGNYFIAGHATIVWNAEYNKTTMGCLNNLWCDDYRRRLRNLINYAESQNNILYVDYSEVGEITDMYENAGISGISGVLGNRFVISDNTLFPYRKRLAINISGGFSPELGYIIIITPGGSTVAQKMITYYGEGYGRYAIAVIPVENGIYSVSFAAVQPQDPAFAVNSVIINPVNADAPAKMDYTIQWSGNSGVWGEYEAGGKFVHGFRFSDRRWVEKDFKTGKLHILGASGQGSEFFIAYLPFSFYKTASSNFYKKYIINASFMRLDMPEVAIRLPERYRHGWTLTITYPDRTREDKPFFREGSSILFSSPVREKGITVIEYYRPRR